MSIQDLEYLGRLVTVNGGNYGDRPAIVTAVDGYIVEGSETPATRLTLNFGSHIFAYCAPADVTIQPLEGRLNDAGILETRPLEAPGVEGE